MFLDYIWKYRQTTPRFVKKTTQYLIVHDFGKPTMMLMMMMTTTMMMMMMMIEMLLVAGSVRSCWVSVVSISIQHVHNV